MKDFNYKVLLPTSGTGSRLGEITKNLNKSLVPLNGRVVISYILDSYEKKIPVVVTLGYLGEDVKKFLEKNYPNRIFEFVYVDKYEGEGTSLGYSMLQAKENLQCPFIFHACDGVFVEHIPAPDHNWIGGFVEDWTKSGLPLAQYRTHSIKNGKIAHFNERGVSGFDSIHIGLDGIFDYQKYWENLEAIYNKNPNDAQISDVPILDEMIKEGVGFEWVPFNIWLDTGDLKTLADAKKYLLINHHP